MKTATLFLAITFIFSNYLISAQTLWTGGGADTNWSNVDNWSTGTVPDSNIIVEIPTGFTVVIDVPAVVQSLTLKGNSTLNLNESLTFSSPSLFETTSTVNWALGVFDGQGTTLTNQGTIAVSGSSFKYINGGTALDNAGTINLLGAGDIVINTNSTLNNLASGIIDFQSNNSGITKTGPAPNVLTNEGLIKTSFASTFHKADLFAQLINNGGIIQVETGTLNLNHTNTTLNSGTYNVFAAAKLDWDGPTYISGTLTGTINGTLNWGQNLIVETIAAFDFSGNEPIILRSGSRLLGGGILTNKSIINKTGNQDVFFLEGTSLTNEGEFLFSGNNEIIFGPNSSFNNSTTGIINFQGINSSFRGNDAATNILNNTGLIIGNLPSSSAQINIMTVNNSGIIEVALSTLSFSGILNNQETGTIKGVATLDVSTATSFTNNGIVAPGASPGKLTFIGNYSSTTLAKLDIELNGLVQETEYDLLDIQGDAYFDGDIQITLGFDAAINDEFIIAKTTGTITNCLLPATKTVDFGGFQYEFSIACRNNNELVLTITNESLGIEGFENNPPITLYPNPTNDIVSFSDTTIKHIEVFDLNGRKVLTENNSTFSVKHLAQGIYIVKGTNTDNISVSRKLIKK